jgi:hypothetical protein
MEILNAYIIPEITVACLMLGFIVKMWVKDVDNKWIPTIVAVVGILAAVWVNQGVSLNTVVGGCASGLLSTGMYEMFSQWVKNGGK